MSDGQDLYAAVHPNHAGNWRELPEKVHGAYEEAAKTLFAPRDARIRELEAALEIVLNGYEDWGGSYVNLQVQESEILEAREVLAKRKAC